MSKHARDLSPLDVERFVTAVRTSSHRPERDVLICHLNFYAGLKAGEIAALRWRMVLTPRGEVGAALRLEGGSTRNLDGRVIPLRQELVASLVAYLATLEGDDAPNTYVLRSDRGGPMKTQSLINWFRTKYADIGLVGASSHSGRRYFITMVAKRIAEVGGSMRDVQELAGHRALSTTQRYIPHDAQAQTRVVDLL